MDPLLPAPYICRYMVEVGRAPVVIWDLVEREGMGEGERGWGRRMAKKDERMGCEKMMREKDAKKG